MATIQTIAANRRSETGTTACQRLRRSGLVPGNVYGHGQDPLPITVSSELVRPIVTSGAHVVNLELDGQTQTALIREVQWDTFSSYVRHLDLVRVDANERVRLSVPVQLKGTAAGAMAGGIVEQPLHSLHIECPAIQVPDFIPVRISHLEIGQAVHVRELTEIPEGVRILDAPEALIVHVVKPGVVEEPVAEAAPGPAEPELIKREKKTEDEEEA
jgi:large subunit ribosomal protein L25